MNRTEEQAREYICPVISTPGSTCNCRASTCLWWKWAEFDYRDTEKREYTESRKRQLTPPPPAEVRDVRDYYAECGRKVAKEVAEKFPPKPLTGVCSRVEV